MEGGTLPLKTEPVAVSKSTEHDVTLTPFVAVLSHSGFSKLYLMCEVDGREGAENLVLICAFVQEISQENERGAQGAEYFCRALYRCIFVESFCNYVPQFIVHICWKIDLQANYVIHN